MSVVRAWDVDLFSDTKTRPSPAMRAAMAGAMVGDEQQDEDPTVSALNARVAGLLGKEAGLFLPSGTMANLVAVLVHCGRGDEILAEASSHIFHFETGGPAGIAGATVTPIAGAGGIFSPEILSQALRPVRRNAPRPRLIWIEQTTNLGGGRVWPIEALMAIRATADSHGLAVHIDGARLLNASVAAGQPPDGYGSAAHSLFIDFSKGLGAPFGAVLAGSFAFIEKATRFKHMLGGAMRQAGVMAAGCLYALDHNVERLSEDHAGAAALARSIAELPGVRVQGPIETNIVIADVGASGLPAQAWADQLAAQGVRVGVFGGGLLRMITHLDVSAADLARAIAAFRKVSACQPASEGSGRPS